jgi:hypothetical protein
VIAAQRPLAPGLPPRGPSPHGPVRTRRGMDAARRHERLLAVVSTPGATSMACWEHTPAAVRVDGQLATDSARLRHCLRSQRLRRKIQQASGCIEQRGGHGALPRSGGCRRPLRKRSLRRTCPFSHFRPAARPATSSRRPAAFEPNELDRTARRRGRSSAAAAARQPRRSRPSTSARQGQLGASSAS